MTPPHHRVHHRLRPQPSRGTARREAQPAGKVYRLGLLSITSSPTGPQSLLLTLALEAFWQSLRDYGYVGVKPHH